MQVTRATFIPLLAARTSNRIDPAAVREDYCGDLTVVYSYGPQFGRRVVTHAELDQMEMSPQALRRAALEHLEVLAGRAEFHGQPPTLMLSFDGLESSLLLATDFWNRLQGSVPGDLVVGVPARDVVIVTGSQSAPGLEKARRCVDRVFMAGDDFPLTRALMVRRGGTWEPFDGSARPPARAGHGPRHRHSPAQPPRQYQEHPSWPGERVAPVSPMRPGGPFGRSAYADHGAAAPGRPMHPATPLSPAASLPPAAPLAPAASPPPAAPLAPAASPPPAAPLAPAGSLPPAASLGSASRPGAPATGAVPAVGHSFSAPTMAGPPATATPSAARSVSPSPGVPTPRRRAESRQMDHGRPADLAPYSAVPYSAVPYSAAPYSAVPYSAVPYSAVPYSAAPYSAAPYSATPHSGSPYGGPAQARSRGAVSGRPSGEPKPGYRDDLYSTGPQPRPLYPDYGPSGAVNTPPPRHLPAEPLHQSSEPTYRAEAPLYRLEPARPESAYDPHLDPPQSGTYPAAWGAARERSTDRSTEWRTGPRARFSR